MPRILIIDDEYAILGLMSLAFRKAGFDVTTANSGESAVAICETERFDAVLSDVTMSGIDGHQTVSKIQTVIPNITAVLMSGFHMACTGACGVATRHCMWLQKPLLPDVAVQTVERLLESRFAVLSH